MSTTQEPTLVHDITPSFRDRIMGCWFGKAVGGTLGQTFEGLEGPFEADFYFPIPTEMVPNDDLDLQVLYACVLDEMENPVVDRHVLAQSWADHVEFPWNEYGVGMRNLAEGLLPPHTGSFDNWYTCGEGAAIRSELWACLAPGKPDLAAAYAFEDACFDHAGDGILAAVFLARLQALAFVDHDVDRLIDGALAGIPPESGIYSVVQDTRNWVASGLGWIEIRALIMDKYGNSDFTDVRPNTGFIILGWLVGKDFSERILICNNAGQDTDSSTASLGALLGILDPSSIDERWLAPIGRDLVINKEITGITPPPTLDGFTDLVIDLGNRLSGELPSAKVTEFDPSTHTIPVEWSYTNTAYGKWEVRDQTELPGIGGVAPLLRANLVAGELPGTWVRWKRADFDDNILLIKYRFTARGRENVRLMFNCTEHYRIWLDGDFFHGAQGTQYMFPAPHMAPVGQSIDFPIGDGVHELLVAIRKPPVERLEAEWVIGLVERPSNLWIENAFRPDRA